MCCSLVPRRLLVLPDSVVQDSGISLVKFSQRALLIILFREDLIVLCLESLLYLIVTADITILVLSVLLYLINVAIISRLFQSTDFLFLGYISQTLCCTYPLLCEYTPARSFRYISSGEEERWQPQTTT